MEWHVSKGLTPYPDAVAEMERRVAAIHSGTAHEILWLLEHPPLYTAGTGARPGDLLDAARFPVYAAGRGGEYTYHGPGQRVVYAMLDLKRVFAPAAPDLRAYVRKLESWLIAALADLGVTAFTREGRVGVWVSQGEGAGDEAKIAAIGVRVRKWVSYHGISLNVAPDLRHYTGIVPCGIRNYGVTSLRTLGVEAGMDVVDAALKRQFAKEFDIHWAAENATGKSGIGSTGLAPSCTAK